MKKILITTDFSKDSLKTIKNVVDSFQRKNTPCHIFLLYTYLIPKNINEKSIIKINDKINSKVNKEMKKEYIKSLKFITSEKIKIEPVLIMGSLSHIVPRVILRYGINIVMFIKNHQYDKLNFLKYTYDVRIYCPRPEVLPTTVNAFRHSILSPS